MSDIPSLQFDRPDFSATPQTAVVCAGCQQSVVQSYYEINGNLVCSSCRERIAEGDDGSRAARVLRACAGGLAVAVAGALLWWGVRKVSGYEVGLISIAIGVGVGKAVRWGSRGRGGWAYQLLAVLLTYASVAGNYMPDVWQAMRDQANKEEAASVAASPKQLASASAKPAVVKAKIASNEISIGQFALAMLLLFVMAAAVPFFAGVSNIVGWLIIAFGLFEAWKINRRVPLTINGPYSVAPAANA